MAQGPGRRTPRRQRACAAAYGSREGRGAGPTLAGAGEMAATAAAANGTGGSSGMEVDAAGNGPCGGGFWRLLGGPVEAFLESREQSG